MELPFSKQSTFFYIALKHDECNKFIEYIKEYCKDYIVSLESDTDSHKETDGEHYHILCNWKDDKKYEKFRDNVIIKIFNLCGKATKDKGRQYGKCQKHLRDPLRCIAYMLKEKTGKYLSSFEITDENLKEIYDISFKKKSDQIFDLVIEYLEDNIETYIDWDGYERTQGKKTFRGKDYFEYLDEIRIKTLEFFIDTDNMMPSRNTLENYIRNFIRKSSKYNRDEKIELIYRLIYLKS